MQTVTPEETTSLSFVERARARLIDFDLGRKECIWYAALELRLGIEVRLQQYLDAASRGRKLSKKQRQAWKAKDLRAQLLELDTHAAQEGRYAVFFPRSGPVIEGASLLYTPVTEELVDHCDRLGELLHFRGLRRHTPNDFKVKRKWLEEVADVLLKANLGNALQHPTNFEIGLTRGGYTLVDLGKRRQG